MAESIHGLTVQRLDGTAEALSGYAGKVLLIVNVASRCGLTPQYAALEALHQQLSGRGFSVLGFPCNQFAGQEPGTAEEIRSFCDLRYRVTFPMYGKVEVLPGPGQSPLYAALTASGHVPTWNFSKYVVGKDGRFRRFFAPQTAPDDPGLRQAIEAALAE